MWQARTSRARRAPVRWLFGSLGALAGCASSPAAMRAGPVVSTVAAPSPAATAAPAAPAQPESPWVHEPHPNLRAVTVIVKVTPPPPLAAVYRQLAARYKRLEPVLRGAAEGGFGSGFALVRRGRTPGSAPSAFIVTNRHVVDLSTQAAILKDGKSGSLDARVVYVDPIYDLAVLAPAAAGTPPAGWPLTGLDVETAAAKDQQPVVASGYPGLGNTPSYQVTRGYVSNERFSFDDGTGEHLYVQHTAPIDPGSSGGPLTTEAGKLLGVNTLKARRRENVGLAVPAPAVAAAVEHAAESSGAPASGAGDGARSACDALLRALALGPQGLGSAERAVGAELAAREGMASVGYLPADDDEWLLAFLDDPTRVLVRAVSLRLVATLPAGDAPGNCTPVDGSDGAFTVTTRAGPKVWTFTREQGAYKLASAALAPPRGEALPGQKPKKAKKWQPSLR